MFLDKQKKKKKAKPCFCFMKKMYLVLTKKKKKKKKKKFWAESIKCTFVSRKKDGTFFCSKAFSPIYSLLENMKLNDFVSQKMRHSFARWVTGNQYELINGISLAIILKVKHQSDLMFFIICSIFIILLSV